MKIKKLSAIHILKHSARIILLMQADVAETAICHRGI